MEYNDDPFNSNNNYNTYNSGYGDTDAINPNPFSSVYAAADENTILTRVFKWMALGLGISAITSLASYLFLGQLMILAYIPLAIVELILVFVFSLKIQTMSVGASKACFIAYSVINGLTLSAIFFRYEVSSIFSTFFITAFVFGAAALYGRVTKKNLASMGTYLFMGLIGIIVAGIVNIFIQNSMLDFIVTIVGLIIFIGLTAYDVNKIRNYSQEIGLSSNEQVSKVVIFGALTLYLDFINLFLKLLSLFGKKRD